MNQDNVNVKYDSVVSVYNIFIVTIKKDNNASIFTTCTRNNYIN